MRRLAVRLAVPLLALSAALVGAIPAAAAPVERVSENGFTLLQPRYQTTCASVTVTRPRAPYQEVEYQFQSFPNAGTFSTFWESKTIEWWRPVYQIRPGQGGWVIQGCVTNSVPNLQDPQGRNWQQMFVIYRATPVGAVAVNVDQTVYSVGSSPYYYVSGPPNSPIYWSSTQNGASTGEVDAFYSQYTDGDGYWSGYGGPWEPGHVGDWTKTVNIGGTVESVSFRVG